MTEFDESSKRLPQDEEKMTDGGVAVPPAGEASIEAASVPLDEIVFEPIPEPADEIVFEPVPAFAEPVVPASEPIALGDAPARVADGEAVSPAVPGPAQTADGEAVSPAVPGPAQTADGEEVPVAAPGAAQVASCDDGSVAGASEAPVASSGPANPFAALQPSGAQPASAVPTASASAVSGQPAGFEPYAVGAAVPSPQTTPYQAAYGSQSQPAAPYQAVYSSQAQPAAPYQAASPQTQGVYGQAPAASPTYSQASSPSGSPAAYAQTPSPSGSSAYAQAPYGASGAYGVPPQSPVPLAPAPVYGYEPSSASAGQKRRWPWFLLGLAVGLLLGLGGCASCMGVMFLAEEGYDSNYSSSSGDYDRSWDDGFDNNLGDGYGFDGSDSLGGPNAGGYGYSYDELAQALGAQGIEKGTPTAEGACAKGFYTVGRDGDIPAGLYYLEGSNDEVSHYYLFDGDDKAGQGMVYEADDSVQYLGNYFAELEEGDVIAFEPAGSATMRLAPTESFNPQSPYVNGCYRVGIDIPAGTYTVTALEVSAAAADEESAAYVMKDLDFDDDSIVDTKYVIAGGEQTVTVTDGQYLELFAATATPAQK